MDGMYVVVYLDNKKNRLLVSLRSQPSSLLQASSKAGLTAACVPPCENMHSEHSQTLEHHKNHHAFKNGQFCF